jgi:hypothetical protein
MKLVECYAVLGRRFYWLSERATADRNGRVPLVDARDSSRGYQALPCQYREVTDPDTVADVVYFLDRYPERRPAC